MPSRARRSNDCCCESAKVKDLRSLKIIGSIEHKQYRYASKNLLAYGRRLLHSLFSQ